MIGGSSVRFEGTSGSGRGNLEGGGGPNFGIQHPSGGGAGKCSNGHSTASVAWARSLAGGDMAGNEKLWGGAEFEAGWSRSLGYKYQSAR